MVEQAKFTDPPLGKALGKQTKTIEDQEKNNKLKQLKIMGNNWLLILIILKYFRKQGNKL